jgi:orotidine-5'-phosphate decarboxylase
MSASQPHNARPLSRPPKEYLVFALDVPTLSDVNHYIKLVGNQVGTIKIGLELFVREGRPVIDVVRDNCDARIFLDLKLHDIPATVNRAMKNIAAMNVDWVTVHCAGQKDMLKAAVDGAGDKVSVLGVTVLTSMSADDLKVDGFAAEFTDDLSRLVLQRAAISKLCGCKGIICSPLEAGRIKKELGADFLAVTPGIRLSDNRISGDDQRRAATPANAIQNGADHLVIGRPIRDAADPVAAIAAICEEIASVI